MEGVEQMVVVENDEVEAKCTKSGIALRIVAVVALIGFAFGIVWLGIHPSHIQPALKWISGAGSWGMLVLLVAFVIIALPFMFGGYTFIALASGFLYGIVEGLR
jgi:uncharacterized membrane protein YdjX (TVP38/TMEM64 family)